MYTQISPISNIFYTENTLHELLCKPKDRVAIENKKYEIDCSNCEAIYLSESKRSLKPRRDKRKNCDCEHNEIAKHC